MAKKDVTKLETAQNELRQAEQAYSQLIGQDTAGMSEEQKKEHQQDCQVALTAKRDAQKTVEDIKLGKA